jgi:hypothetical protein
MSAKVVGISFYAKEHMPAPLQGEAMRQGLDAGRFDLVAVKTKMGKVPFTSGAEGFMYEFEVVEPTPEGIRDYVAKLALEDGTDINVALRRAFGEKE